MITTLKEMTKPFPEIRELLEKTNFNLQWEWNGKEYIDHWSNLNAEDQKLIIETVEALGFGVRYRK